MYYVFICIIFMVLSFLFTGFLRKQALNFNLIDMPNHRSSHSIPTPRGGGLSFVVIFLLVLPFLNFYGYLSQQEAIAFGSSGVLVAFLGFLDDRYSISALWRLLGHFLAACLALYCIGGMPNIGIISSSILATFFGLFYLVWLLNLYNFMDGIDGIAGIEALSVCLGIALIYSSLQLYNLMILPLLLASLVIGFLLWNFPRAYIFMGDVGSGFLGIILGVLSLQAALTHPKLFWAWLILLAVFIVDSTITLIRRIWRGHKIVEAHCTHAYQNASKYLGSHYSVSIIVCCINLFWLLPIALLSVKMNLNCAYWVVLAYTPLIGLAILMRAGLNVERLQKDLI